MRKVRLALSRLEQLPRVAGGSGGGGWCRNASLWGRVGVRRPPLQRAAAEYNKMQERMASERAEAQYQAMLREQLDKTAANMDKFTNATKFGSSGS